jgi:transposase
MQDADGPSPASTVDPSKLLPDIIHYCLSESEAPCLWLDPVFMSAQFRVYQIVRLLEFASTELDIALSSRSVARAFGISHSAIKRAKLRGYEDPPGRGRHCEIEAEPEQELIDWIANKAVNNMAVNKTELFHECNERFGKKITRGWVDSFVKRHSEQLFETKSVSQENPRLEVPRTFLEATIEGFQNHVHNSCAELIFNLGEIGISEWEDRTERRVIVPSTMRGQTIFHGIRRNLKHISVVACISAAGEHITPFFVCSQINDTVERRLKTEGFIMGVDLIIKRRTKPYMNSQLFAEYISTVLLPYIDTTIK